jgi:hypothetical protein
MERTKVLTSRSRVLGSGSSSGLDPDLCSSCVSTTTIRAHARAAPRPRASPRQSLANRILRAVSDRGRASRKKRRDRGTA